MTPRPTRVILAIDSATTRVVVAAGTLDGDAARRGRLAGRLPPRRDAPAGDRRAARRARDRPRPARGDRGRDRTRARSPACASGSRRPRASPTALGRPIVGVPTGGGAPRGGGRSGGPIGRVRRAPAARPARPTGSSSGAARPRRSCSVGDDDAGARGRRDRSSPSTWPDGRRPTRSSAARPPERGLGAALLAIGAPRLAARRRRRPRARSCPST